MPETQRPETVEQMCAQHFGHRIDSVVARLHRLAQEVEQCRARVDAVSESGRNSYANIATDVQHTVLWGLANLSLDGLTVSASDADRARERGIAAEAIAATIDAKEAASRTVLEALPAGSDAAQAASDRASAINGCAWLARDYAKREA